jgi:hypothetical protein
MKSVVLLILNHVVFVRTQFQADAPKGRWLNGETPPKNQRHLPAGTTVACPTDFSFCVDTKWSDAQTCLHPNPHLIKRCMDLGCIESPFGRARAAAFEEDTYCKDFMSREGRYCQWTEKYMCNCPSHVEDIVFANAIIVNANEPLPHGYRIAKECIYPTPNMKRMPNGAYVDVPIPGEPLPPPIPDDPKLKGNLSWVDPRGEAPDATLRPRPELQADRGTSNASPQILCIMLAVIALSTQ